VVPKLFASGKSFKSLAAYLLHDAEKAQTSERVRWTHTLNLASDEPGLAVHEMLWSYRAAEDLKRQAGVKAGGRQLKNPVRHFSLNWHPSETPSSQHMIETVENFLAHMGWQEHQALIVCHDDKHPHVHVMVNSVHPETGRALDTSFEKRRAQAWALAYERQHELIFCEERLKPAAERTPSPTRESWRKLREYEQEDDKTEAARLEPDYFDRHDTGDHAAREWVALKNYQREQREEFFVEGREAYREVRKQAYREVRAEMREKWRGYYQAHKAGADPEKLSAWKAGLLTQQHTMLDERRQEACSRLREQRDEDYRALLDRQKEERAELTERQRDGLPSYSLLDLLYPGERDADRQEDQVAEPSREEQPSPASPRKPRREQAKERDRTEPEAEARAGVEQVGVRGAGDMAGGAAAALAAVGERLFDGFFGGAKPVAPNRRQERVEAATQRRDAARSSATQTMAEARQAEETKQAEWWEERKKRRRERD
jgi:Relaxase/Mobilisation nuclease domain